MSKISKILPATTFGFAPMVTNSLGQSYQSGPSTNLEPSWPIWANYFWISLEKNTPSLEHPLDIKQQFLSTLGWRKLIKNFSTYRWEMTTSIHGINFNLTCSPTTGLPLFPNLIWIFKMIVSSPWTSQSSQISNCLPSPTNHATTMFYPIFSTGTTILLQ